MGGGTGGGGGAFRSPQHLDTAFNRRYLPLRLHYRRCQWRTHNPGILKDTGHCTEGRVLIEGRWAPQIGNWLIRRFLHAELHSKVSGARVG